MPTFDERRVFLTNVEGPPAEFGIWCRTWGHLESATAKPTVLRAGLGRARPYSGTLEYARVKSYGLCWLS